MSFLKDEIVCECGAGTTIEDILTRPQKALACCPLGRARDKQLRELGEEMEIVVGTKKRWGCVA